MLDIMRKKAGSWLIKIILFAIVIVFIFWGVGSYRSRKTTHVADINGTIITYGEYRQAYQRMLEQYRRIYGARLNDEMLKLLRLNETALDQMVYRILMLQEAERLGLQATADEISSAIHQIPAFQKNGVFDLNLYKTLLARNAISVEAFEKEQREDLLINKLRAVLIDGITVQEADALQWYQWQNTQISLSYLLYSPDRYKDISPTDEQISSFYAEHKNNYLTDLQVKVQYLFFDPKAFEAQASVSPEEVQRYYSQHPEEFNFEKTVQARHILFKVDPDADQETVNKKKEKALEVYELAKKGRSFAELAKQYSEDPSRDNGGDLGTFTKDTMVKPFAEKAFAMQANEISEPVLSQFGWHIIKVEKVNPATTRSLESAREDIKAKILSEKAREMALEKAESVYDSLFDGDDLSKIETSAQVVLDATDYFSAQKPPRNKISDARKFADSALALDRMAISNILELDNGFYLLQATDRIEPAVPPLEDIRPRVRADVVKEQQNQKAMADAQAALTELNNGKTFSAVAAASNLEIRQTDLFARNGSITGIGYEPEINRVGYGLSAQKPLASQVIKTQKGWLIISLKERKPPEEAGFTKEKEAIISRLTDQKKQDALEAWMADAKSRASIDINRELIR